MARTSGLASAYSIRPRVAIGVSIGYAESRRRSLAWGLLSVLGGLDFGGLIRIQLPRVEPAHVRQRALHATASGDQLGCDRDGNLIRSDRADIESDGSMYMLK